VLLESWRGFEKVGQEEGDEAPDGAFVKVVDASHPVVRGIPWETCPPFLGYNKLKPKPGAQVLATIGEGDPFIVVWERGGRAMAFASDPVLTGASTSSGGSTTGGSGPKPSGGSLGKLDRLEALPRANSRARRLSLARLR
jgi:hypothetical protein